MSMEFDMRSIFIAAAACLTLGASASAETEFLRDAPSVKVVNFTADWCPNCTILNPRLDEAIERFEYGQIKRIDLDMTDATRRAPEQKRMKAFSKAIQTADRHQASYLWDWYGGLTGLAVFISADNGEPLTCVNRAMSVDDMEARLKQAVLLAENGIPGERKPGGPDCPAPRQ